ncbi:hypothetical protein HFP72_32190 [Nocardiopsis sp. ARC36]
MIAQALGFHDKTTTQVLTEAGESWDRYAPQRPRTVITAAGTPKNTDHSINGSCQSGTPLLVQSAR